MPYHDNPLELFGRLATLTFADLCLWIHEGAETLIRTAQLFAPEDYVVVGDSLGGFISVVAAQRDSRISHCVLLACSGDICDAATRLHRLNRALALVVGRFAPGDSEDLKTAARKAASGEPSAQHEFELVDTLNPDRLSRLRNLLILGDKRDPLLLDRALASIEHLSEVAQAIKLWMDGLLKAQPLRQRSTSKSPI